MMFAQRLSTAPEPSVACGAGRWWSPSYAHQPRSATNSSAVPSSRREERRARGCSATRKHLPWVVPRARLFVFRAVGPHGRTPRALLCRRKPGRASGIVLVITASMRGNAQAKFASELALQVEEVSPMAPST